MGLALFFACAALILYERSVFRGEIMRRVSTHAEIIALNSESPLRSGNRASSSRTLAALRAEPDIAAVRILDEQGQPFAQYLRDRKAPLPPELAKARPDERRVRFVGNRLLVARPIVSDSRVIGSVVIVADTTALRARILDYLGIAAAVFLVSLVASSFLSARLYRTISSPIRELARAAREISAGRSFGVRAHVVADDELGLLATSFNEMLSRVEQRESALRTTMESFRVARDSAENAARVKSHFLSLVSHELRTPLTALQLNLENLRRSREPLPARVLEIAGRMRNSVRRQAELVESLLEHSRIESGKLTIEVGFVDVEALVEEVVEEVRLQAEEKGLALRIDAEDVPLLATDARLLRLVLINFLSNAVKFTDTGSVVTRLSTEGSFHRIDVTDTGPGIPSSKLDHIFEPFEHVEPINGKHTPGFGLGLALVRQMAEVLKARIAVQTEVAKGTTFTIYVPALETTHDVAAASADLH